MKENDLLEDQSEKRRRFVENILASDKPRKLIVAGPGTGKTFTFGAILKNREGKQNLAVRIQHIVESQSITTDS